MGDFLKLLARGSIPGLIYSALEPIWKGKDSFYGQIFGKIKDVFNDPSSLLSGIEEHIDSYLDKTSGAHLTPAEVEQNEWTAEREDTRFQRAVADMQAAGLNPALMYGSGASAPSVNSSASGIAGSGSISDLLQLAMLPLQMKAIKAEIGKTNAETGNIIQRTRTEEQETQVRTLVVEWLPKLNEANIGKMFADIDLAYSRISMNEAQTDFIHSQKDVQNIMAEYLPAKYEAEIRELSSRSASLNEDAKFTAIRADFERIQRNFARDNHFLMSSNDTLLVVTYIASLLGMSTDSVTRFIKEDVPKIVNDVAKESHMYGLGGPHK